MGRVGGVVDAHFDIGVEEVGGAEGGDIEGAATGISHGVGDDLLGGEVVGAEEGEAGDVVSVGEKAWREGLGSMAGSKYAGWQTMRR